MKRIIKILSVNILIIIFLLILCEGVCFCFAVKFHYDIIGKEAFKHVWGRYFDTPTYVYYDVPGSHLRPVDGTQYNKKPIFVFGCSVAYGNKLENKENLSGQLSNLTKRPVYNLANDGWSFAHMLKQLQANKNIDNLDPEYIIYTYINDQRRRMYFIQGWPHDTELYLRYVLDKNGNLKQVPKKYHFWYRFLTVKYIQYQIQKYKIDTYEKSSYLMLKMFEESTNIIKKKYPNAKLILLLYDNHDCQPGERKIYGNDNYFNEKEYKSLENMGFKIYNIEELIGKILCTSEYKIDNNHPNKRMWEEFLPIFIKELNM